MPHNKLNISKIKYYSEVKGISLRKIARELEMTPTGFNLGVTNQTLRANTLNEVLNILDLNYYDLVENTDTENVVNDKNTSYTITGSETLSELLEIRSKVQLKIDSLLVRAIG